MMMRTGLATPLVLASLLGAAGTADAQSLGIGHGPDLPEWIMRWSPLSEVGSLARHLPSASAAALSLRYPQEKVGLFWSGGNPAALAWDVTERRTEMSVARASESGTYRRPLDPAAESVSRIAGMGWQPLESRGAVVGRILFDRTVMDPGTNANVNRPYSSIPLVVTDTSISGLRQTRALLEGAGGWRFGGESRPWGAGFALGYDTRSTSTIAAPFVRRNRAVLPAASLGIMRQLNDGKLQLGVRAGWQGGEETLILAAVGATGGVFQLEGYREVPLLNVGSTPFYRRISRRVFHAGPTLGGSFGRHQWVAYGDVGRFMEHQTNARQEDPPMDAWHARSLSAGAALRLPHGERSTLVVDVRSSAVSGKGRLSPDKTGLRAHERVTTGRASWRVRGVDESWELQLDGALSLEARERTDSVARASTRIDAITPRFVVEADRRLWGRLSVLGAFGYARYGGSGSIPSLTGRDSVYLRFFSPELDIATSVINTATMSAGVHWRLRSATELWLTARAERMSSPTEWFHSPGGTRSATTIAFSVVHKPSNQER